MLLYNFRKGTPISLPPFKVFAITRITNTLNSVGHHEFLVKNGWNEWISVVDLLLIGHFTILVFYKWTFDPGLGDGFVDGGQGRVAILGCAGTKGNRGRQTANWRNVNGCGGHCLRTPRPLFVSRFWLVCCIAALVQIFFEKNNINWLTRESPHLSVHTHENQLILPPTPRPPRSRCCACRAEH